MRISKNAIEPDELRQLLTDEAAGGYVAFEGWIRNENEGQQVLRLEYEVYEPLAITEGLLEIGDCAVWVGVSSAHRDEAFAACRYIIDEVKIRLPIWKKEYYANGDSGWVNCERCAAHAHPERRIVG
jgi:molybdopterin synthase catalytic subunit